MGYITKEELQKARIRTDISTNTKELRKSTKELTKDNVFKIQKKGKLFDKAASPYYI